MLIFHILTEMAYPKRFSFETLNKLRKFKDKKDYIASYLNLIGEGSSRIVYKVDREKAIKIAKNRLGQKQNKIEVEKCKNYPGCFAHVYETDPKAYWIEAEIATSIKEKDFKRLYGVSFADIGIFMAKLVLNSAKNEDERKAAIAAGKKFLKFAKIDLYREFNRGSSTINPDLKILLEDLYWYFSTSGINMNEAADYMTMSNWGIVKRNGKKHAVIIDAGLNEEIFLKYYDSRINPLIGGYNTSALNA